MVYDFHYPLPVPPQLPMEPNIHSEKGLNCWSRLERAQRVLERLRKVFNHDLPNHLVAIEGLVRLLELDEEKHLSLEGKEYLNRLSAAASRVQKMARQLRELARLGTRQEKPERVDLNEMLREVQAALNQLCPSVRIEYRFSLEALAVRAGRRSLTQALIELLGGALSASSHPKVAITLGSTPVPKGIDLWSTLHLPPRTALDPLTLTLIEELLADCGGTLTTSSSGNPDLLFCIHLPDPGIVER